MTRIRIFRCVSFFLVLTMGIFCFPHSQVWKVHGETAFRRFSISILAPEDYQPQQTVGITVLIADAESIGIAKAEIKQGENGKWLDITSALKQQATGEYKVIIGVQGNGEISVSVTGNDGSTQTESKTIHYFDSTPPILEVSIQGKRLYAKATDSQSGVKSIYVGSHSFSELDNDRLDMAVKEYFSDSEKNISVYALDNAGNKSRIVQVINPNYIHNDGSNSNNGNSNGGSNSNNGSSNDGSNNGLYEDDTDDSIEHNSSGTGSSNDGFQEATDIFENVITIPPGTATKKIETPIITQPSKNTSPSQKEESSNSLPPVNQNTNTPQQNQTPTTQAPSAQIPNITINVPSAPTGNTNYAQPSASITKPASTPSISASQEESKITPNGSITPTNGTGTVIENSTQTAQTREFFTIETESGNIFYIVIDKQKQQNNVYLLSAVNENDLIALAEKGAPESLEKPEQKQESPDIIIPKTEKPEQPQTEEPLKPDKKSPIPSILLTLLFMCAVFGVAYYFKIYKPGHSRKDFEDEDFEDDYEYEEENEDTENQQAQTKIQEVTNTNNDENKETEEVIESQMPLIEESSEDITEDFEEGLSDEDYY